ncbi:MAG: DUF3431 domain-containing protein [Verrucomicrobiota bacterium]
MPPLAPTLELVIARYQEDLRWLKKVPPAIRLTILNKGDSPPLPEGLQIRQVDRQGMPLGRRGKLCEGPCEGVSVTDLPNVGREAHSYLRHLTDRYDSLADVTLFCQGHPFDHAPDFHIRLQSLVSGGEFPDPFLWYGFLEETDDPLGRRLFVPWSKNPERRELPTGGLFQELFLEKSPEFFHFRGGAQFAVLKSAVLGRSRAFYRKALELTEAVPDAAHCFERFWDRVFGAPVIDPAQLGPDGVNYLKRIRRLMTP